MRVPVRFDYADVNSYYHKFFEKLGTRAKSVLGHHFDCLLGPLAGAETYLGLARDLTPFGESNYRLLMGLGDAIARARFLTEELQRQSFPLPPSKEACRDYQRQLVEFAKAVPGSFPLDYAKPLFRDCDNVVHMTNAMFSPDPTQPEIFERLEEYHQGRYPEIFAVNR